MQSFKTDRYKQNFCGPSCREINKNNRINANWLNERKVDHNANDRIEYARVSKKPVDWMKKFKACRG